MTSIRLWLAALAAIGAMVACDARSVGETYDNACRARSDCDVVLHARCGCSCDLVAINVEERDRFAADSESFCLFPQPPCEVCAPVAADCIDGVCVIVDCSGERAEQVEVCREEPGLDDSRAMATPPLVQWPRGSEAF